MAASDQRFDVVVIGAGPGGYVAALRARQRGLSAAVIERDRLGGVCANQGCIPTKALLRSAEVYALARNAASFGVTIEKVSFDIGAIAERAKKTAARMEKSVESLLRSAKIPVFQGSARLAGDHRVAVSGGASGDLLLEAAHIVLATGARARVPSGFESDGRIVWTYREALTPAAMPRSILVMGAGAIGVEFASFYRMLGAEVTLVEMLPRILPMEDKDISEAMRRAMTKQGVRILTDAKVAAITKTDSSMTATVETGSDAAKKTETITADHLLVATGISANVEDLGLEQTKVRIERGHIVVDEWLATDEPGIYAIGDLVGPPWLAHKASREAVICIDRIAGAGGLRSLAVDASPSCTYAMPQVASVGLTEEAAVASGRSVRCGRSTFVGNGKARALGDTEGFVKTVFDADSGELLGAHMIGPEVTELVATFALARTLEATEEEILATVFPHPTLSEAVHESVEAAFPVMAGVAGGQASGSAPEPPARAKS
ncbi:MAG TPA: dihydrolipoyl dehydrogenase [Candidatus Limnocylindrales bacterium]|nr:dihydrolipoyl dehydrogenase [Candidatus Limnocylindrales bacterium]